MNLRTGNVTFSVTIYINAKRFPFFAIISSLPHVFIRVSCVVCCCIFVIPTDQIWCLTYFWTFTPPVNSKLCKYILLNWSVWLQIMDKIEEERCHERMNGKKLMIMMLMMRKTIKTWEKTERIERKRETNTSLSQTLLPIVLLPLMFFPWILPYSLFSSGFHETRRERFPGKLKGNLFFERKNTWRENRGLGGGKGREKGRLW